MVDAKIRNETYRESRLEDEASDLLCVIDYAAAALRRLMLAHPESAIIGALSDLEATLTAESKRDRGARRRGAHTITELHRRGNTALVGLGDGRVASLSMGEKEPLRPDDLREPRDLGWLSKDGYRPYVTLSNYRPISFLTGETPSVGMDGPSTRDVRIQTYADGSSGLVVRTGFDAVSGEWLLMQRDALQPSLRTECERCRWEQSMYGRVR